MEEDLLFLEQCSNEQLKHLADILVFDRDGKKRLTEALSNTQVYVNNYPNNVKAFLSEIIKEYRKFGSNAVLNLFLEPKSYIDILGDVCKQLKVPFHKGMPVELVEHQMLQTLMYMAINEMSAEDIKELVDEKISKAELLKSKDLFIVGGPLFLKVITVLVMQLASKAVLAGVGMYAARFAASRWFAVLTGPIGIIITGLWSGYDLAGPAYRVTIPFTISVAYYRVLLDKDKKEVDSIFEE